MKRGKKKFLFFFEVSCQFEVKCQISKKNLSNLLFFVHETQIFLPKRGISFPITQFHIWKFLFEIKLQHLLFFYISISFFFWLYFNDSLKNQYREYLLIFLILSLFFLHVHIIPSSNEIAFVLIMPM